MVLFSGCGGSSSKDDPAVSASAQEMEEEFRALTRGTIEAAETDPKTLRFTSGNDFSYGRFAAIDPAGYCGKVEGGDYKGHYEVTLKSKNVDGVEWYTVEQYQAKVTAVWEYWRALGMEPKNAPTDDNARDIYARTPLGGKVSYMAGQYGEYITVESACSEKIKFGQNRR